MAKRVVLAVAQREYAAKLAEYVREEEPGWDIVSFTHASALRRELQDGQAVDLLIGQQEMIHEAAALSSRAGKILVLVDTKGNSDGEWQQIIQYQPLPSILSNIRGALAGGNEVSPTGCQVLTVFSASGGTGKTTVALNLIRQAGERGLRTFYLNMEALNATSLLFGKGEPDSLSRLLYSLQAHPEQWGEELEKLCRHQPQLRTDFLDAPDHPGERLALGSELLQALLERFRNTGRYDLIVIDPDSGAGEWHRRLIEMSDRVVWLTVDDAQLLSKTAILLYNWRDHLGDNMKNRLAFVMNKGQGGGMVNRWDLPGGAPSAILPYIPQWKAVDQPGRLLGAPGFSGAVEQLLDRLGIRISTANSKRRREEGHGVQRTHVRGTG